MKTIVHINGFIKKNDGSKWSDDEVSQLMAKLEELITKSDCTIFTKPKIESEDDN